MDIVAGSDIGQRMDPTAIAVTEVVAVAGGPKYHLRFVQRLPLDTPYPAVAEWLAAVVGGVYERGPEACVWLVVDATGCGRLVVDLIRVAVNGTGCRLTAATFPASQRLCGHLGDPDQCRQGVGRRLAHGVAGNRAAAVPSSGGRRHAVRSGGTARRVGRVRIEAAGDRLPGDLGSTGAHDDIVTAVGLSVTGDPAGAWLRRLVSW